MDSALEEKKPLDEGNAGGIEGEDHQSEGEKEPGEDFEKVISFQSFVKEAEQLNVWVREWVEDKKPVPELKANMIKTLQRYQEFPQLLDPHLENIIVPLMQLARKHIDSSELIHPIFAVIYTASKVRGYKTIIRFFPHEVMDLEPTLQLLEKQNPRDHETWETRYILLLWLSILALVPFDLSTIDALIHGDDSDGAQKTLIERVVDQCKLYMHEAGPIHQAAGILVSRLLTRTDMHKTHLSQFLLWCKDLVLNIDNSVFVITGTLSTLSHIFKNGQREDLLRAIPIIYDAIMNLLLHDRWRGNALFNKLVMKVIQRIGLAFLKPRVAYWRYQRGNLSLLKNLQGDKQPAEKADKPSPESLDDEDFELPENGELEAIIDALLQGLRDKDTIVRWSVAKGIGRITGRLPRELGDEIVGSVLELFNSIEGDTAWHGACLATAELARRGLLLPNRLETVVPLITQALLYDVRKGACSVGAYVRDAACYVCWAFARAYAPEVLAPHMYDIAKTLILVTVFDREVNCRRAASAAFQENVGRQGTFPHGIEILTQADYFAVGNRFDAYTKVAIFVSQFEEYRQSLIDHLIHVKIKNWDKTLRTLASHTLGLLTKAEPKFMQEKALDILFPWSLSEDLFERHGAVLAISEILVGLHSAGQELTADQQTKVRNLVINIEKARLYRGRGGEIMRGAACRLIECIAKTSMVLPAKTIIRLQQSLEETLKHPNPDIQIHAVDGIKAFGEKYYSQLSQNEVEDIVIRFLKSSKEDENPAARRGYALALGVLPFKIVRDYDNRIIDGLIEGMKIDENHERRDGETRRNSAISLQNVFATLTKEAPEPYDILVQSSKFYQAFMNGMDDYCTDNRGDIGSWVRDVCMKSLGIFSKTILKLEKGEEYFNKSMSLDITCAIAKQCVEKIDRVRDTAGQTYKSIILSKDPKIPFIPHHSELVELLTKFNVSNWSAPSETYPMFAELLRFKEYRYAVLNGLIISVGGLTESIVKHSGESFKRLIQVQGESITEDGNTLTKEVLKCIVQVFKDNSKNERVIIPLLKTLDFMLSNDLFAVIVDKPQPVAEGEILIERQLYSSIREEIRASKDIPKLMVAANVISGLLIFPSIRTSCLQQLFILLCHKFPKVRKHTADQLYLRLLTLDQCVSEESYEDVLMILSGTQWLDPVAVVRPERDKLFTLTGVPKPETAATRATPATTPNAARSGEDDSYKELVKEMGF